jgi:MFS transporter, PAT family, solute carrier family 33 (acetyl-CoA transportor), member 1
MNPSSKIENISQHAMDEDGLRQRKLHDSNGHIGDENDSAKPVNGNMNPIKSIVSLTNNDNLSIFVLLVLYTLQGIPMGLSASIPMLLKERKVSYEGLSLFSMVGLPFSLKLLWAPIVDSCYFKNIGRRKSWLIPIQLLTGIVMITASYSIDAWLGDRDGVADDSEAYGPNVRILTIYFFSLYFLMATQDIAVDGWALTMLSREHVGWASTANSIGQALGVFLANQGFIALSDTHWCHRFLGMPKGEYLLSLPGFMRYWGWIFLIVTVFVAVLKKETNQHAEEDIHNLLDTYKQVIAIFKLRPVQMLAIILLTSRIGFSAADAVSSFKMQEYGMPKADIALVSPILMIISLILPAVAGHSVASKPIDMMLTSVNFKLFTSLLLWAVANIVIYVYDPDDPEASPGLPFYCILIFVLAAHEIASNMIFLSAISFFAKVSDPLIGGTYMTLLNTISNLGSKWPQVTALWLLPKLTQTVCENTVTGLSLILPAGESCLMLHDKSHCKTYGGSCRMTMDGYTVETVICFVVGLLWIYVFRERLAELQHLSLSEWSVQAPLQTVEEVKAK